jgi:hypothetical protein
MSNYAALLIRGEEMAVTSANTVYDGVHIKVLTLNNAKITFRDETGEITGSTTLLANDTDTYIKQPKHTIESNVEILCTSLAYR